MRDRVSRFPDVSAVARAETTPHTTASSRGLSLRHDPDRLRLAARYGGGGVGKRRTRCRVPRRLSPVGLHCPVRWNQLRRPEKPPWRPESCRAARPAAFSICLWPRTTTDFG